MPLLDAVSLAALRRQQENAVHQTCPHCSAQTWPNYCRECDAQFTDGHYSTCPEVTRHQQDNHRRY